MLDFYASEFLAALQAVTLAETHAVFSDKRGAEERSQQQEQLRSALTRLAQHCSLLPVSQTLVKMVERAAESVTTSATGYEQISAMTLLMQIRESLIEELKAHRFYCIPGDLGFLLDEAAEPFGARVNERFPEASYDIRAAGRCIAKDEWTACVFHLMRAVEHGLRALAVHVEVPIPVDLESWKAIIDQIEKRIRAMEALPKSPEKSEQIRRCSEVAAQFRYFKDAWRNHVAHGRSTYDHVRAGEVWQHTRNFMAGLAAWV